ncbi:MAG: tetratricopeptide repeat protein [Planctomycetota bacterium]
MNHRGYLRITTSLGTIVAVGAALATCSGCGPTYRQLRFEGMRVALEGQYGPASVFFTRAEEKLSRRPDNLHDLGVCHVMISRQKFAERNTAAAYRELDKAIGYYKRALDAFPDHQACAEGLNVALELQGQYAEALKQAEWRVQFVGPSAKQYIFLAQELEERGNVDDALLRYRQGISMEPNNPLAYVELSKFLLRHDNGPAAIPHLSMAAQLDPQNDWVRQQLASLSATPRVASQRVAGP